MKKLLIVFHSPSPNTKRLFDAIVCGAKENSGGHVEVVFLNPLEAGPADVLNANAIILGTTENLGYMSGALKDFFDRCYYPCLEKTEGTPYCLVIRAGQDGTGTKRGVESIVTGLRWKLVQEPLILHGNWRESFVEQCHEIGSAMAAGMEASIF